MVCGRYECMSEGFQTQVCSSKAPRAPPVRRTSQRLLSFAHPALCRKGVAIKTSLVRLADVWIHDSVECTGRVRGSMRLLASVCTSIVEWRRRPPWGGTRLHLMHGPGPLVAGH
eukprot:3612077-Rhodomonas_salina.2